MVGWWLSRIGRIWARRPNRLAGYRRQDMAPLDPGRVIPAFWMGWLGAANGNVGWLAVPFIFERKKWLKGRSGLRRHSGLRACRGGKNGLIMRLARGRVRLGKWTGFAASRIGVVGGLFLPVILRASIASGCRNQAALGLTANGHGWPDGRVMPFRSEAQRRFMWARHPDIARRWTAEYGSTPQPSSGQGQKGGGASDYKALTPGPRARHTPFRATEQEATRDGKLSAAKGARPGKLKLPKG